MSKTDLDIKEVTKQIMLEITSLLNSNEGNAWNGNFSILFMDYKGGVNIFINEPKDIEISEVKQIIMKSKFEGKMITLRGISIAYTPITLKEVYYGGILFISKGQDLNLALCLTHLVVKIIKERIIYYSPRLILDLINEIFQSYGLTKREREVAFLWFQNGTAEQISKFLYISKDTVQTLIKKFYQKMSVSNKSEFIAIVINRILKFPIIDFEINTKHSMV